MPDRKVIQVRGRRYRVLEKLSGRSSECYRAVDERAGRRGEHRAIHIYRRNQRAVEYVKVLRRAGSNNSNLPGILESSWDAEEIVLVLPWIKGPTLEQQLARARRDPRGLSSSQAIRLFRGLAHGLCHFNTHRNLIHGDLHPGNVVVIQPSRLVMIDYGSSWFAERTTRREARDGGTERYAAPELLQAETQVDFRADQFSATVMWYEMLTTRIPYEGIGGRAGLQEYREWRESYVAPSRLQQGRERIPASVWKQVDQAVRTGLQLDPDRRYPSRSKWLKALEDIKFEVERTQRLSPAVTMVLRAGSWIGSKLGRQ